MVSCVLTVFHPLTACCKQAYGFLCPFSDCLKSLPYDLIAHNPDMSCLFTVQICGSLHILQSNFSILFKLWGEPFCPLAAQICGSLGLCPAQQMGSEVQGLARRLKGVMHGGCARRGAGRAEGGKEGAMSSPCTDFFSRTVGSGSAS